MTGNLAKPADAQGQPVDASFSVSLDGQHFHLYYASRGGTIGTASARNTQYHIGLTLLLERMKRLDAEIDSIMLDSRKARSLPPAERRLRLAQTLDLPIKLSAIHDIDHLRRLISDAQKDVASAAGRSPKHGNRMRSIRLLFRVCLDGGRFSADEVQQYLVSGHDWLLPTTDPVVLLSRATHLAARQVQAGQLTRPSGNELPPVSQVGDTKRYLRLPSVAAYVLARARGRCELCSKEPFMTDAGRPFLEIHHVWQLASGGPDTPANSVALCPDCHRELHYGCHRDQKTRELYRKVQELVCREDHQGLERRG